MIKWHIVNSIDDLPEFEVIYIKASIDDEIYVGRGYCNGEKLVMPHTDDWPVDTIIGYIRPEEADLEFVQMMKNSDRGIINLTETIESFKDELKELLERYHVSIQPDLEGDGFLGHGVATGTFRISDDWEINKGNILYDD